VWAANFAAQMDRALKQRPRMIAVLSPSFCAQRLDQRGLSRTVLAEEERHACRKVQPRVQYRADGGGPQVPRAW
jgi:hypothetical protein